MIQENSTQLIERDPHGIDPHALGAKLDDGKPLVMKGVIHQFPNALMAVATVSEFGANKYTWGGWQHVTDGISRYGEAMSRHLVKEAVDGFYDTDSQLLHAAHAAWNSLARLELMLRSGIAKSQPNT